MPLDQRINYKGISQYRTVEEVIDIDYTKGDSAKVVWETEWDSAIGLANSYSTHPEYSHMYKIRATIERIAGNRAKVTIAFEGIQSGEISYTNEPGNGDSRIFSLEGSLSTEPIETHKDFDKFATPANGVFPSKEKFERFDGGTKASTDPTYKKGLTSYLSPGLVYSENRVVAHGTIPSRFSNMDRLGKIDNPPDSSVKPRLPSGMNWLLVSATVEQVGRGVRVSRSWRSSRAQGWDPDLYK